MNEYVNILLIVHYNLLLFLLCVNLIFIHYLHECTSQICNYFITSWSLRYKETQLNFLHPFFCVFRLLWWENHGARMYGRYLYYKLGQTAVFAPKILTQSTQTYSTKLNPTRCSALVAQCLQPLEQYSIPGMRKLLTQKCLSTISHA